MSRGLIAWVLLTVVGKTALALPPLEQLESRVELSATVQLADQAFQAAQDNLSAGHSDLGVSLFGNVGGANNHDIIDPTHSYSYNEALGGAGLLLPLLGSRLQLQDALGEKQLQVTQLDTQRQLQRRELIRRLRKAYGDYWQAQQIALLAHEYLGNEPEFQRVAELRTRSGLLLDSDRLDFASGFALAHRDAAASDATRETALALIREITGSDLDGGPAVRPIIPSECVHDEAGDAWVAADPELLGLQRIVAQRESNPRSSPLYPVQSNIQVSYQARDQTTTGQRGSAAQVSWSFQVPLDYASERHLLARASAAQLSRAHLEYEVRRQELQQQRHEIVSRAIVLRQTAEFAKTRLAAAESAVSERTTRARNLEGDVIEQLQRAHMQRYGAVQALVQAEAALTYWYADWARFETTVCQARLTAAGLAPGSIGPSTAGRKPDRALYVWRAGAWLNEAADERGAHALAQLQSAGIDRLLVSLDAVQMQEALANPTPLSNAVMRTRQKGVQVALLLGDPHWILPAHRKELLNLIQRLESVPFDAVHLDLEPAQLDPNPEIAPVLLGLLADTLSEVSARSPWRVELSVHPRDLEGRLEGTNFADMLHSLGITPTVMIYVANPERVGDIAAPLLQRHPNLSMRIALSVEKSLGREESLWSYPEPERRRRIEQIESRLTADNFAGITLQFEDGWTDGRGEP